METTIALLRKAVKELNAQGDRIIEVTMKDEVVRLEVAMTGEAVELFGGGLVRTP